MDIVGIDPGLVHTGVVAFRITPSLRKLTIVFEAFAGPDATGVLDWMRNTAMLDRDAHIFIEGYRNRGNSYNTDTRMRDAIRDFKGKLPQQAKVLDNTGVKKVVTDQMMRVLEVFNFNLATNHQDLRSAARIGIYGALKDPELNELFYRIIRDYLDGDPWDITIN